MLNLITAIKGKYWLSQHKRVSGTCSRYWNVCELEIPAPEWSSGYSWALWKRVKGLFPEGPQFSGPVSDPVSDLDYWPQVPEASPEGYTDMIDGKVWGVGIQKGPGHRMGVDRLPCGLWFCKVYPGVLG